MLTGVSSSTDSFRPQEVCPFLKLCILRILKPLFVNQWIFSRELKSLYKGLYITRAIIYNPACQPWTSASLNFHWFLFHKILLVHILAVAYNKTEFFSKDCYCWKQNCLSSVNIFICKLEGQWLLVDRHCHDFGGKKSCFLNPSGPFNEY